MVVCPYFSRRNTVGRHGVRPERRAEPIQDRVVFLVHLKGEHRQGVIGRRRIAILSLHPAPNCCSVCFGFSVRFLKNAGIISSALLRTMRQQLPPTVSNRSVSQGCIPLSGMYEPYARLLFPLYGYFRMYTFFNHS